jgi:ABC-type oligopeptide transport system substrate-binding subunit
MKKICLIAIFAMAIMLLPIVAPQAKVSAVTSKTAATDTTTYYIGDIGWGPIDASPGVAYDTASGELLFNTNEGLIEFGTFTQGGTQWAGSGNPYPALGTNNGELYFNFNPVLSTNVPDRSSYVMTIHNTTNLFEAVHSPTGASFAFDSSPNATLTEHGPFLGTGFVDQTGDGFFGAGDNVYLWDQTANTYRTWTVDAMTYGSTVSMTLWRGFYTFHIRTTPINFYNCTGAVQGAFSINDIKYSYSYYLIQDCGFMPQWILDMALFNDAGIHAYWRKNETVLGNDKALDHPNMMDLAHLIDNAYEINTAGGLNDFIINVGARFPDNAFKQTLSNTFMYVQSKAYDLQLGAWNGNLYDTSKYGQSPTAVSTRITGRKAPAATYVGTGCMHYPDWWLDWARYGSAQKSLDPTDQPLRKELYCGTGPYYLQTLDSVGQEVIMKRNPGYWRGWPATDPYGNPTGDPANPPNIPTATNGYLDTIDIKYIASDTTREGELNSGVLDAAAIPISDLPLMTGPDGEPSTATVKTTKNINPEILLDANMFTFNITEGSAYIGSGHLPDGIPLDFFYNTNVRKAFAYSFNQTQYINEAWHGEASNRGNPFVLGLYPDYYNTTYNIPSQGGIGYDINYRAAYNCLTNATFTVGATTKSLWDWGFSFVLTYNTGNTMRDIACLEIKNFFTTLQTMYGCTATFTINILEVNWDTFISDYQNSVMPMFDIGWLADFADADDFIRVYLTSGGSFSSYQIYDTSWGTEKDTIVNQALFTDDTTPAGKAARQALYNRCQQIYYNDVPSFPVATPNGRRWCNYWVKGWYYDAVYPGLHAYTMWKQDTPWYDVSGSVAGQSDGKVNMKDIAYLVIHFNAKAPSATITDPKWVGAYGANGCVDPYGDRVSNMKDIAGTVARFNKNAPGNP